MNTVSLIMRKRLLSFHKYRFLKLGTNPTSIEMNGHFIIDFSGRLQ